MGDRSRGAYSVMGFLAKLSSVGLVTMIIAASTDLFGRERG